MRPPRPIVPPVNFDSIPKCLRREQRWCVWNFVLKRDDHKWTKVPMEPGTTNWLRWSNRDRWINFQAAKLTYEQSHMGFGVPHDGIGFFLGDGFSGIDLDNVVLNGGALCPDARYVLDALDSYVETSPRGRGPKVFFLGAAPTLTPTPLPGGIGTIESYSSGRFFAMTGNVLPGSHPEPQERSNEARQIVEWVAPKAAATTGDIRAPMTDDEIRNLVLNYTDGTRHETRVRLVGHLAAKGVSPAFAEELFITYEHASAIIQKRQPTSPAVIRAKVRSIYEKHARGRVAETDEHQKFAALITRLKGERQ